MTFKFKDQFNFGICMRFDKSFSLDQAAFFEGYTRFVYEPKDDKFDRKYYIKGDLMHKMLMIGFGYCKEGFKHTVEASSSHNRKNGIMGTPCSLESSI